eukprot:6975037-Prymnesium_polylepis.2
MRRAGDLSGVRKVLPLLSSQPCSANDRGGSRAAHAARRTLTKAASLFIASSTSKTCCVFAVASVARICLRSASSSTPAVAPSASPPSPDCEPRGFDADELPLRSSRPEPSPLFFLARRISRRFLRASAESSLGSGSSALPQGGAEA